MLLTAPPQLLEKRIKRQAAAITTAPAVLQEQRTRRRLEDS
jgi:hypothetical protein